MALALKPRSDTIEVLFIDLYSNVVESSSIDPHTKFEALLDVLRELSSKVAEKLPDRPHSGLPGAGFTLSDGPWWYRIVIAKQDVTAPITDSAAHTYSHWLPLDCHAAYDKLLAFTTLGVNANRSWVEVQHVNYLAYSCCSNTNSFEDRQKARVECLAQLARFQTPQVNSGLQRSTAGNTTKKPTVLAQDESTVFGTEAGTDSIRNHPYSVASSTPACDELYPAYQMHPQPGMDRRAGVVSSSGSLPVVANSVQKLNDVFSRKSRPGPFPDQIGTLSKSRKKAGQAFHERFMQETLEDSDAEEYPTGHLSLSHHDTPICRRENDCHEPFDNGNSSYGAYVGSNQPISDQKLQSNEAIGLQTSAPEPLRTFYPFGTGMTFAVNTQHGIPVIGQSYAQNGVWSGLPLASNVYHTGSYGHLILESTHLPSNHRNHSTEMNITLPRASPFGPERQAHLEQTRDSIRSQSDLGVGATLNTGPSRGSTVRVVNMAETNLPVFGPDLKTTVRRKHHTTCPHNYASRPVTQRYPYQHIKQEPTYSQPSQFQSPHLTVDGPGSSSASVGYPQATEFSANHGSRSFESPPHSKSAHALPQSLAQGRNCPPEDAQFNQAKRRSNKPRTAPEAGLHGIHFGTAPIVESTLHRPINSQVVRSKTSIGNHSVTSIIGARGSAAIFAGMELAADPKEDVSDGAVIEDVKARCADDKLSAKENNTTCEDPEAGIRIRGKIEDFKAHSRKPNSTVKPETNEWNTTKSEEVTKSVPRESTKTRMLSTRENKAQKVLVEKAAKNLEEQKLKDQASARAARAQKRRSVKLEDIGNC